MCADTIMIPTYKYDGEDDARAEREEANDWCAQYDGEDDNCEDFSGECWADTDGDGLPF